MNHYGLKLDKYHTAGITYLITKTTNIVKSRLSTDGKNIISTNISHEYPFKLSIRASKLVDGKRKIRKKVLEFSPETQFAKAIKESINQYDQLMLDMEQGLKEPSKPLTIDSVWNEYVQFKSKKGGGDEYRLIAQEIPFYNRHVKEFLGYKEIEAVVPQDILDCREAMTKADGTSYAIKTKLGVNLCITKVFKYYNFTKGKNLSNPAEVIGDFYTKIDNARKYDLTIEETKNFFQALYNYTDMKFRNFFIWSLHGFRKGEIMSLQYKWVDWNKKTITVPKEFTKARFECEHKLTPLLFGTLDTKRTDGYIFSADNSIYKPLSTTSVNNHFHKAIKKLSYDNLLLHQCRNAITMVAKNDDNFLLGNDTIGIWLKHSQSTITDRYGKTSAVTVGDKLHDLVSYLCSGSVNNKIDSLTTKEQATRTVQTLDNLVKPKDENEISKKLEKLRLLLPEKTDEQLIALLELL